MPNGNNSSFSFLNTSLKLATESMRQQYDNVFSVTGRKSVFATKKKSIRSKEKKASQQRKKVLAAENNNTRARNKNSVQRGKTFLAAKNKIPCSTEKLFS